MQIIMMFCIIGLMVISFVLGGRWEASESYRNIKETGSYSTRRGEADSTKFVIIGTIKETKP